eukprot:4070448-Prymnesium_polylepis.1
MAALIPPLSAAEDPRSSGKALMSSEFGSKWRTRAWPGGVRGPRAHEGWRRAGGGGRGGRHCRAAAPRHGCHGTPVCAPADA